MAQYHRTGSSGILTTPFLPTQENDRTTDIGLAYVISNLALIILNSHDCGSSSRSEPSFRFDTQNPPMLKSAKLLRF